MAQNGDDNVNTVEVNGNGRIHGQEEGIHVDGYAGCEECDDADNNHMMVTIDGNVNILPDLAESWEVQDGGRVYLFRLHRGVRFHDGTACDAEAVKWNLTARGHATKPAVNNAANHLVVNDLETGADYPAIGRSRWRGPYVRHLTLDPWGNAYIISVGAMEMSGSPIVLGARGWIVSAGPNGVLETAPDAAVLGGDDIGTLVRDASAWGP